MVRFPFYPKQDITDTNWDVCKCSFIYAFLCCILSLCFLNLRRATNDERLAAPVSGMIGTGLLVCVCSLTSYWFFILRKPEENQFSYVCLYAIRKGCACRTMDKWWWGALIRIQWECLRNSYWLVVVDIYWLSNWISCRKTKWTIQNRKDEIEENEKEKETSIKKCLSLCVVSIIRRNS